MSYPSRYRLTQRKKGGHPFGNLPSSLLLAYSTALPLAALLRTPLPERAASLIGQSFYACEIVSVQLVSPINLAMAAIASLIALSPTPEMECASCTPESRKALSTAQDSLQYPYPPALPLPIE